MFLNFLEFRLEDSETVLVLYTIVKTIKLQVKGNTLSKSQKCRIQKAKLTFDFHSTKMS